MFKLGVLHIQVNDLLFANLPSVGDNDELDEFVQEHLISLDDLEQPKLGRNVVLKSQMSLFEVLLRTIDGGRIEIRGVTN